MIIKATFNDRDYTQYLEDFFWEFHSNVYWYLPELNNKSEEELDNKSEEEFGDKFSEFCEKERIQKTDEFINKLCEFDDRLKMIGKEDGTATDNEISYFLDSLKTIIIAYLKDTKLEPRIITYLSKKLKLKLVKRISDTYKNDEVVYYFIINDKFISM